ncbi:MAG TPA: hypothetical protein PL029_09905, partial [Bacteroidia bacterium]|nr:hypothetical protein [Bacteroidia bacterium]
TPIGTNGIESHKKVNKMSLNILGGVAKGVNGIELGGFANVDLQNVKGLQMAGFTNVVLKDVRGAQFAGYLNYSGGNFTGAAFSGFCNINIKKLKGAQLTGFFNMNKDSLTGAQFAGFCNSNFGNLHGGQFSGYFNYNHRNLKGAQLAGFGNINAGDIEGAQVSGFFNYAKKVKGLQLGFINIADSVDGASIGFLNLVKKGLHQVEISADELFYANLALRTGTHRFYNIFSAGASPGSGALLWHIGYGIGTSLRLNENLRSDIAVSAQHVSSGLFYFATSEVYKIYIGMEYKLRDKCYIAAGPTFNMYFGDALLPAYAKTYSKVAPYSLLNETNSEGFNFKGWIGAKVAIRFL